MRNTKDRDDGIRRLDLSDEFLLDSAEKRYSTGDYMGALTMLNKRAGMLLDQFMNCLTTFLVSHLRNRTGIYNTNICFFTLTCSTNTSLTQDSSNRRGFRKVQFTTQCIIHGRFISEHSGIYHNLL